MAGWQVKEDKGSVEFGSKTYYAGDTFNASSLQVRGLRSKLIKIAPGPEPIEESVNPFKEEADLTPDLDTSKWKDPEDS